MRALCQQMKALIIVEDEMSGVYQGVRMQAEKRGLVRIRKGKRYTLNKCEEVKTYVVHIPVPSN